MCRVKIPFTKSYSPNTSPIRSTDIKSERGDVYDLMMPGQLNIFTVQIQ